MSSPDYESFWTREKTVGWLMIAAAFIGALVYHYWIQSEILLIWTGVNLGMGASTIRLATLGRDQAETLQEREGEIDWALEKLRNGEQL